MAQFKDVPNKQVMRRSKSEFPQDAKEQVSQVYNADPQGSMARYQLYKDSPMWVSREEDPGYRDGGYSPNDLLQTGISKHNKQSTSQPPQLLHFCLPVHPPILSSTCVRLQRSHQCTLLTHSGLSLLFLSVRSPAHPSRCGHFSVVPSTSLKLIWCI